MVPLLFFLLVISSFAVCGSIRFGKNFEELLPISAMGTVLILFLAGLLNILAPGAIILCVGAIGLYVYTIVWIAKYCQLQVLKERIFNLVNPASIIFIVMAGLLAYWNKGRLAMHTDEFSHWLDTVVIMTRIDAFGTTAGSGAIFPSYPPAMSLFQYLLEKINIWMTGDFSEWKVYYAYQLFAVIILLPFIKVKGNSIPQKIVSIITWPICLMLPLYFFNEVYSSLYIDPFLGLLGASGFAVISIAKEKDWLYTAYVSLLIAILVLSKDVGIYLAIFISIYFVVDYFFRKSFKEAIKLDNKGKAKYFVVAFLPLLAMIGAKMLWKLELAVSNTFQKFSQPFDIQGTIDTIRGDGGEFYTAVYENFKAAITYRYIYFSRIGLNYVAIMVLTALFIAGLQFSLYRRGRLTKASAVVGAVVPSVAIVVYILSMFPLYISRFVEEEALNLASFDRYCGIMFLTGLLLIVLLLRDMLEDNDKEILTFSLGVCLLLWVFNSKKDQIQEYTSRYSVEVSIGFRTQANELATKINQVCEEDTNILVMLSDGEDICRAMLSTLAKPRNFDGSEGYFPNTTPEDVSSIIAPDVLLKTISTDYDYVAIYSVNDCLANVYSGMFDNPSQIMNGTIFKINPDTGKLVLVE